MMFGFAGLTDEMIKRILERDRERERRVDALLASNKTLPRTDAYLCVNCEMEWEERDAAEQEKLRDIRENGT